jgi:selenocysteine lyase/cysteine desulfurase
MGSFSDSNDLRDSLHVFYKNLYIYEQEWSRRFLEGAREIAGMKIYGITDMDRLRERSPTFAFTIDGYAPKEIPAHLAKSQISAGSGTFYANGLIGALGLLESGGVVRAGALHYNRPDEIDRFFEVLKTL